MTWPCLSPPFTHHALLLVLHTEAKHLELLGVAWRRHTVCPPSVLLLPEMPTSPESTSQLLTSLCFPFPTVLMSFAPLGPI